jgi:hypothetical protein
MTDEATLPTEQPQPTWFIDHEVPGIGERPSWLSDKFKTVADLAKSYSELEKKVGMAPEDYSPNSKYIDPDYAPFQDFLSLAKEKRVPKDVVDKVVESVDKYLDEFAIDPEEEIKELGSNAKERLTVLDNWAQANLSKDSYEALTNSLTNAKSIKALEEIRSKMMSNNAVIPPGNEAVNTNVMSVDDLQKELQLNHKKYKEDETYRRDWQGRLAVAAKSSNYIDKMGS